jgi:archaellum biogenesis ATPase FlaH
LELKSEVVGDDIKNIIYVRRWKAEKDVTKVIKFRVEPKFGIVIDISAFAI